MIIKNVTAALLFVNTYEDTWCFQKVTILLFTIHANLETTLNGSPRLQYREITSNEKCR